MTERARVFAHLLWAATVLACVSTLKPRVEEPYRLLQCLPDAGVCHVFNKELGIVETTPFVNPFAKPVKGNQKERL